MHRSRDAGAGWCATEDAAALPLRNRRSSLATLLASHILRDGELVLLILRPSLWFIPIQSMLFSAVTLVFAIGASLADPRQIRTHDRIYFECAAFLIASRLMWATLQWMGRLYVLTDMRVLRVSGVFTIDVFDCPLRKIAEARLFHTVRERLLALGSVLILPVDDNWHYAVWQTVNRPAEVHARILAAISKARQSGLGGE